MAEIKISELSVGDWVRYDRGTDAVQIMGIYVRNNQECVVMSDSYYPDGVIGFVEHIKPIPLTPEILEKNGISKTYESDEYAVYKGEGFNVTEYYTELWEFERHRNRLMIRNVHQLQHALRLAGVGKEIEV